MKIALIAVCILIVMSLSGCIEDNTQSDEINNQPTIPTIHSRFIGTWKQELEYHSVVFSFFADGTCSTPGLIMYGVSGVWEIKNNRLVIDNIYEGTPYTFVYDYVFSKNYQSLYLYELAYETEYNLTKQ